LLFKENYGKKTLKTAKYSLTSKTYKRYMLAVVHHVYYAAPERSHCKNCNSNKHSVNWKNVHLYTLSSNRITENMKTLQSLQNISQY